VTLPVAEGLGPARLVVSDRRGGVSRSPWEELNLADHVGDDPAAVATNRGLLAQRVAASAVAVVAAEHGNRCHRVSVPGTAPAGDALVTTQPGLALLALSADCVAGAVAAPDAGALAVFHAGWRGLVGGVVETTITALVGLGARPGAMSVRLGPAICPGCYEVAAQVREAAAAASAPAAATTRNGAPAIDLIAGVRHQLRRAGVLDVRADLRCTAEDRDLFSYRRDGTTGRQGVLAVLPARGRS